MQPDAEWTIDIPGYARFKPIESNYDLPKVVEAPGVYVVMVTDEASLQATTLVLGSDLDVIVKASREQLLAFAREMKAGKGRAVARVLIAENELEATSVPKTTEPAPPSADELTPPPCSTDEVDPAEADPQLCATKRPATTACSSKPGKRRTTLAPPCIIWSSTATTWPVPTRAFPKQSRRGFPPVPIPIPIGPPIAPASRSSSEA